MRPLQPIPLSAPTREALDAWAATLAAHLERMPGVEPVELAQALAARPTHLQRRVLVVRDRDDAIEQLRKPDPRRTAVGEGSAGRRVGFVLAGPAGSSRNMMRDLYEIEPLFRERVDALAGHARKELDFALGDFLYGSSTSDEDDIPWRRQFTALFAVEYALAQLWQSWGVQPVVLMGYSLGELVGASLSGVFEPTDGLALAHERGRLIDGMPGGAMTSVGLGEPAVRRYLTPELEVAVSRSDRACVVSGPLAAIADLEKRLAGADVPHMRLDVRGAGHSVLVDPVVGDFSAAVERVARSEPRLPIVSNVTGRLMSPAQATSPTYWGSQLRKTVQLAAGVRTLLEHADVLLELGPSAHLTSLIAGQLPRDSAVLAVPSMATMHSPSAPGASYQSTLLALGKLWAFGVEIDWYGFWGSPLGEHVDLPAGP